MPLQAVPACTYMISKSHLSISENPSLHWLPGKHSLSFYFWQTFSFYFSVRKVTSILTKVSLIFKTINSYPIQNGQQRFFPFFSYSNIHVIEGHKFLLNLICFTRKINIATHSFPAFYFQDLELLSLFQCGFSLTYLQLWVFQLRPNKSWAKVKIFVIHFESYIISCWSIFHEMLLVIVIPQYC